MQTKKTKDSDYDQKQYLFKDETFTRENKVFLHGYTHKHMFMLDDF